MTILLPPARKAVPRFEIVRPRAAGTKQLQSGSLRERIAALEIAIAAIVENYSDYHFDYEGWDVSAEQVASELNAARAMLSEAQQLSEAVDAVVSEAVQALAQAEQRRDAIVAEADQVVDAASEIDAAAYALDNLSIEIEILQDSVRQLEGWTPPAGAAQ